MSTAIYKRFWVAYSGSLEKPAFEYWTDWSDKIAL